MTCEAVIKLFVSFISDWCACVLVRAIVNVRLHPCSKQVRHDSANILGVKMGSYRLQVEQIRGFYQSKHRNWITLDAKRSRWTMRALCQEEAEKSMRGVQEYLTNTREGKELYFHPCLYGYWSAG